MEKNMTNFENGSIEIDMLCNSQENFNKVFDEKIELTTQIWGKILDLRRINRVGSEKLFIKEEIIQDVELPDEPL